MSQENVELVRRALEAFATGGTNAMLAFYAPDCIVYPIPGWLDDPVYRGHGGVRQLTSAWIERFDEWGWEIHELRSVGDRVVNLAHMTGKIKGSNVALS